MRLTVRTRLALWFTALFVVFGAALVAIGQVLLRDAANRATDASAVPAPADFRALGADVCLVAEIDSCGPAFAVAYGAVSDPFGSGVTISFDGSVDAPIGATPLEVVPNAASIREELRAAADAAEQLSDDELLAGFTTARPIPAAEGVVASFEPRSVVVTDSTHGDYVIVLPDGVSLEDIFDVQQELVVDGLVRDQRNRSMVVLLVAAALAAAGGTWLAGRALRPVHRVTEIARQASAERLDDRIRYSGGADEVKELADTFDDMLDRLQSSIERHRRFAADASHELRTPVATLRAEVDAALADPAATDDLRALATRLGPLADRSERLIASLLALSRAEGRVLAAGPLDLGDLVGSVVDDRLADLAGVRLDLRLDDAATVRGDAALLRQLVDNLIDNAAKYTPGGGAVEVAVEADGDVVRLRVDNEGDQLPTEEVAALAEPFHRRHRTHDGRDGHGLGLAIVDSVARAHDATLDARPRPGGGLSIVVTLPALVSVAVVSDTTEVTHPRQHGDDDRADRQPDHR